jgi:release factor glutamine methyltransferase
MAVRDPGDTVARLRAAGCVFAEDEAALLLDAASAPTELEAWVARRVAGEPLEVIVGWVEFFGMRWAVDRGVFVPRRRSELLVREAMPLVGDGSIVVELCAGVAAIAGAIAAKVPGAEVYAAELDPAAASIARRNLRADRVFDGNLYDPLPLGLRGRIDILVANAPYVPTAAIALMPPEARDHEPLVALDGGADGLDVQRRVVADAPDWLAPGGRLLIETSEEQASSTAALFEAAGLDARIVRDDDLDATVVVGRLRT